MVCALGVSGAPDEEEAAGSKWNVVRQVDEWGDETGAVAVSQTYSWDRHYCILKLQVEEIIFLSCDYLNLTGGDRQSMGETHQVPVKIGANKPSMKEFWEAGGGENYGHFAKGLTSTFLALEMTNAEKEDPSSVLKINMPYYGGSIRLEYLLRGLAEALNEAGISPFLKQIDEEDEVGGEP